MATKKTTKAEKPVEAKPEKKEEYKLKGGELVEKVKEIINEGNARRIIIKDNKGKSIMEIPLTFGVVGALLAPYLAAVGALAAVLTSCSIVVEKK